MGGRADSEKGPRKRDATRGREGGREGGEGDMTKVWRIGLKKLIQPDLLLPPSLTPPHGISMQHYVLQGKLIKRDVASMSDKVVYYLAK